ncbi:hypothetical protein D9758_007427 [Tetrapyrgos nigripes]|uniref:Uncharacterized protein n=1 Tax=Tetrapyrgos nigripes TaxID=182062 RepID=A0A8H5LHK2_9AGAR|nr:hypothetical protein D9758_007427 [Tetrapyrgos nigripes]
MARRAGPRLHRLPQRLDYTLIPAPLDLSLPLVAEKSPLPAIIVTPSSPSDLDFDAPWRHGHSSPDVHTHDYSYGEDTHRHGTNNNYSIAFLAAPRKPTLSQRISEMTRRWQSSPPPPAPSSPSESSYFPLTPDPYPSTPSKSKFRIATTRAHLFNGFGFGYGKGSFSLRHGLGPFLLLSLILFVMICHLITHQLASSGPSLDLQFASSITKDAVGGVQGSLNINNMHGNMNGFPGIHGSLAMGKMVPGPGERGTDSDADASNVKSDADGKEHLGNGLEKTDGDRFPVPDEGRLDDVADVAEVQAADAEVEF